VVEIQKREIKEGSRFDELTFMPKTLALIPEYLEMCDCLFDNNHLNILLRVTGIRRYLNEEVEILLTLVHTAP